MKRLLSFLMLALFAGASERPNILWITSEDNSAYLGCYGDEAAQTPNLDALAARGVRFSNCFANAPVCAVARSTWILGVPAVSTATHHMRSNYRTPADFIPYPVLMKEAGYYVTNNAKTDYNNAALNPQKIWDACGKTAHYKNREPGQPFFAVFNLTESHESGIFADKFSAVHDAIDIPADGIRIPPYQVETPEMLQDWQRVYQRMRDMDRRVGLIVQELEELGEAENTLIFYCSDHGGITLRSKRYLHDSGTRVPFIVYTPEKWRHLAPGEVGSVSDRLTQFLDMPRTFLSLMGIDPTPQMMGRVFTGPDQLPAPETVFLFSGRFGASPDTSRGVTDGRWKYIRNYEPDRLRFQMQAYSLLQSGQVSQWNEHLAGRTTEVQSAHYRPQPPEELYDTENDPHEINNLADEAGQTDRLNAMRTELDRHILRCRDLGFLPEPTIAAIDADPNQTAFKTAASPDVYPLGHILRVANLAVQQNPEHLSTLEEGLVQPNPVVRYWAAVGLRALGADAKPAGPALVQALQDDDACVRITAAVALGNIGQRERATAFLVREAKAATTDALALWALDGLKYLDAPEAVDGLDQKEVDQGVYSAKLFGILSEGGSMWKPVLPE